MSEPTTQEIRERDKRTGSCTYCWTHKDGLDAAADRGILLKKLKVRERTSQFHKSNHLAAEKHIKELEAKLNFDTTDDGGTMERILRRRVKKLESQLAMVHRVSGCDQFRCVFSSRQDHCPEAIIHRDKSE